MIDTTATQLALRNRAIGLTVCTTGSTSLAQTPTGFSRLAGSFVTDGFKVGMEVTPTGFATAVVGIITAVAALALTVSGTRVADPSSAGRTISVGLPALRAFENTDFTRIDGRPYLEEDFVPAPPFLLTANAANGTLEETGLYVLKWYGLSNYGLSALRASTDALRALFAPGTSLAAGTDTVRISSRPGPYAGQILPVDGGWSVITLTIPWRAFSTNAIAA